MGLVQNTQSAQLLNIDEHHSLTGSFHRVNRIIPENQVLITIPPDTTVHKATDLMKSLEVSHLPVVQGNEVLGVFSFESFSTKIIQFNELKGITFRELPVDEFIDAVEFVHIYDDINLLIAAFNKRSVVLVGQPNRLQGIITVSDLSEYLHRISSPFILLQEIEMSVRKLIQACVDDSKLKICTNNSLSNYYGVDEMPTELEEMTFNDYVQIVGDGRNWQNFAGVFGGTSEWQRKRTRAKLEEIRNLRNDIFHFRREMSIQDLETLGAHRDWLLRRARTLEAKQSEQG